MSRREDTHRSSLPHSPYLTEDTPPKALDGQYPHGRKSTGLVNKTEANEGTQRKIRKLQVVLQSCKACRFP